MGRNTLFESMWNQDLLDDHEREPDGDDDEKPKARSITDAIFDIHRATLNALIEVSRPPRDLALPASVPSPYPNAYVHTCPACQRYTIETDDYVLPRPPNRPLRCTVCGSAVTLHNGVFCNDANGILCRGCAAARGDVPPARQPAPDTHVNDGVLVDDHDSMLDEPEVATPGLGSLDGSDSLDEHAMTSLDEQAVGERTTSTQPSEIPVPDLSRDLKR